MSFIPLHDLALLDVVVVEQIQEHRIALLKGINLARIIFALCLIGVFYLLGSKPTSIQLISGSDAVLQAPSYSFLVAVFCYIFILLMHLFALKTNNALRWTFLSCAFFDAVFIYIVLKALAINQVDSLDFVLALCSLLLSVLTLNFRESVMLGVMLGLLMLVVFFYQRMVPYVELSVLTEQTLSTQFRQIAADIWAHNERLVDPVIFSFGLMLMTAIVGYLASQARDNRISSKISVRYNQQLRALNDSIIEESQSGLVVVNANGLIVTLNKQARDIFRIFSKKDLPRTLSQLSDELAKRFGRWLHMQFNDNRMIEVRSGQYSAKFSSLSPQKDLKLTLITLESIEESMQRVRETRLVSLGRLTAGIAHEIRNPLASVQSAAEILQEDATDKQVIFLADKITTNAKRMNVIISDILNMFSDKPRNTRLIDLNMFIERIVAEARHDVLTKEAQIFTQLEASDGYAIYFDPGHLSQIVTNLIMNSINHGRVQNVQVLLKTQISKIGRQVYLDVIDNGLGVKKEDQDRIFEPFYSKRNSTGLGLYLVREMCVANQAQIVYLRPRRGACFRITMERYLSDGSPLEDETETQANSEAEKHTDN